MELYQRVRFVAREVAGSETRLAADIGVQQRTFNGYLKASREHNLWPLLPKILEVYPQISREWLYFDEGEMYDEDNQRRTVVPPLRTVTGNHGRGTSDDSDTDLRERIRELEQKLELALERVRLQQELIHSKDKIIALYEQRAQEDDIFLEGPGQTALIQNGAAPSSPHDNEEGVKE